MNCILCSGESKILYTKKDPEIGKLNYWLCEGDCQLIFLDPTQRLTEAQEKARYDLHNNDPNDEGYVNFLRKLTDTLMPSLQPGSEGLDFGCGPGPTLSKMLARNGFTVHNYDPFYFPNESLLSQQYDFITATEVLEHVFDPRQVVEQLATLLKPNGILAIMTETVIEPSRFADWWYHSDPTHVCFYSRGTFEWVAQWQNWNVEFPQKNIVLFKNGV